jgi:hypothetical protein
MSRESSSDILWGAAAIGEAAGILNKDGSVNVKVTFDRLNAGIIPGFKRGRIWQSARSLIEQKLREEA